MRLLLWKWRNYLSDLPCLVKADSGDQGQARLGDSVSVRISSAVWERYQGGGSELLVLLALADHADDTGYCYPSIAKLADKARLSRSQTQRVVHRLIAEEVVSVVGNATGGAPGSTRQYRIQIDKMTGRTDATPTGSTHATGSADATGRMDAQDGAHGCAETGSTHATQTVSESSITVREDAQASPVLSLPCIPERQKKEKTREQTFEKWADQTRAAGQKLIADYLPVWDYADRVGIPADWIDIGWLKFVERYTKDPVYFKKKYIDWRKTFKNAIEGNWLGLWFYNNDGECRLTTAGIQADRDTREAA